MDTIASWSSTGQMEKKVKYQVENFAMNILKCSERELKQWRIQDFPERGRQSQTFI